MDILNIDQQIELLQTIGYTLNVEEKFRLKIAHSQILNSNENLDELKFWGKIEGIAKTYLILIGLRYKKSYQFPHKTFFWASSADYQFKQVPELLLQHQGLSQKYNAYLFSGDPNKILVNLEGEAENQQGQPPEEAGENKEGGEQPKIEEDEEVKKVPKKNFTELNRLSYIVRSIEHDASSVPRNSYKMTPQHELHPNQHFYGLTAENALHWNNWLHFRAPITPQARKNIEEDLVIFNSHFLDNIETDFPKGGWSIQLDSKRKDVSLRSLLWPGYFSFHRLDSNLFGSAYIGEGVKNTDLPFMI